MSTVHPTTFLRNVLGFELSDIFRVRFTDDPAEPEKRIHFLHCKNARPHSLAIMDLAVPSGCIHVMAESRQLERLQLN